MKKRISAKKILMALHDGKIWQARVKRDNGSYKFMSSEKMDDTALPEEIIKWGIENGASSLRVILSRELNDFSIDDPAYHLMPANELYETLAGIIADKTSQDSEEIAPSLIPDADLGTQNTTRFWGTGIELQNITNYSDACHKEGLKFEGATTLQAIAMLENVKNSPNKNLIFLGEKDSFVYASTPSEVSPEYKYIPMACPNSLSNEEFYRRLLRRLAAYTTKPFRIICPDTRTEEAKKIFQEKPNSNAEFLKLSEFRTEILQVAAEAHTYLLDASAGLVSVAPKKKDAKYTGTVICFASIIISALILGGLYLARTYQVSYWSDMKAKVTTLNNAQKAAADEFNTADKKLKDMRALILSLNKAPVKIEDNFLNILCIISDTIPPTSWISSISQEKSTKKVIITGKTLHLKTHSDFVLNLNKELAKYKKEAIPRKMLIDPKIEESIFELELANKQ